MYTFKVPSGIGDLSWIYSKLVSFKHPYRLEICGDEPRRTLPFSELLPGVQDSKYADFQYWKTFVTQKKGLPVDTNLNDLDPGTYYLSANHHLDNGGKLADFLPDLPTKYHYKINTTAAMIKRVDQWMTGDLEAYPKPHIGVYTSKHDSYRADWRFWKHQGWTEFLEKIHAITGGTFVFIGADFDTDLTQTVACCVGRSGIPRMTLVGQTHIGEVWHLLKRLDYLFAYASGIGILGDVVNVPTTHYLPTPRHDDLCDTYANPANIESGRHINKLFCTVDEAVDDFKERGLQWLTK